MSLWSSDIGRSGVKIIRYLGGQCSVRGHLDRERNRQSVRPDGAEVRLRLLGVYHNSLLGSRNPPVVLFAAPPPEGKVAAISPRTRLRLRPEGMV
jgi:hypothetical protein